MTEYANALIREINLWGGRWPYRVVDSIYIGGGTPSLIPAKDMNRIMRALYDNFAIDENAEITIEVNPATVSDEKFRTYRESGINRISIGVQSFDNSVLRLLGRIHDKNDALTAVRMAKKAGFENISVDLMFAIPGQTMKMWKDTVRQCIFLRPQHISLYSLTVEEGTKFYQMIYEDKILQETSDEKDREMYHEAIWMLNNAGYNRYEISNVAIPGYESKHNLKYWSYKEYLGIGPGASSFIDGKRFKNFDKMKMYLESIKHNEVPVGEANVEDYTLRDEMGVYAFTGLRKSEGFNIDDFEKTFEYDFFDVYDPAMIEKYRGLLVFENGNLRLTDEGMDVSNQVMAEFV